MATLDESVRRQAFEQALRSPNVMESINEASTFAIKRLNISRIGEPSESRSDLQNRSS